jgi:hypothetical protein
MIGCYDCLFWRFSADPRIIVLATPNLSDQIRAFVQDLKLEQIQSGVNASFPVPQGPHPQLYEQQHCSASRLGHT